MKKFHSPLFTSSCALLFCLSGLAPLQAQEPELKSVKVKDITMEVPADWKQEAPTSSMRAGQFVVPAAKGDTENGELVIFYFGAGGAGSVKANLDRWIGQFAEEGRKTSLSQGTAKTGKYYVADVTGTYNRSVGPPIMRKTEASPDSRMIAVILSVEGKGDYFLKLTGKEKTVAAAADALRNSIGAKTADEKEYK